MAFKLPRIEPKDQTKLLLLKTEKLKYMSFTKKKENHI